MRYDPATATWLAAAPESALRRPAYGDIGEPKSSIWSFLRVEGMLDGNCVSEEHMTKSDNDSAPARIDKAIAELGDWRGQTLSRMRKLIREADPDVVEEVKWVKPSNPAGVPTWSHEGIICTAETYKTTVKLTFAKGASLEDPSDLFNSSLAGNTRRAIDIHEGQEIDARAFKALIRAAVEFNTAQARSKRAK